MDLCGLKNTKILLSIYLIHYLFICVRIYLLFSETELQDFSVKEGDSFNPLVEEITATFVKQQKLENDTAQSIQKCQSQGTLQRILCMKLLAAQFLPQEAQINLTIDKQELQVIGALAKSLIDLQIESDKIQKEINDKVKANNEELKKCRSQ